MRIIGNAGNSARKVTAVASGALATGDTVVVNADGTVSVVGGGNLTAENFIGTAATGAADAQRAKINIKGAVDENQSGLTAGQSYYVQVDGTLGTTPADPSVFAGTAVSATKLIVKG